MYVPSNGLEHLLHGEPAPDALHREEYYAEKHHDSHSQEEPVEPSLRQRAVLLRAQVAATVGKFFA